jgi:serine phosphatase RsbU (regulator of sigma subunit)
VAGVLAVTGDRAESWSPAERELLAGLAAQGGQALERARLYERERSAAEQLQDALLPRQLPRRTDIELAARYLPGVKDVPVGGDWYDCVECDHQLVLVVGDVIGMGLDAAVLMGQLRTATRVLASLDPSPVAVLRGLDDVVAGLDEGDVFATVVYVRLDLQAGTAEIARAGHVPPLLLTPAGASFVTEGGSLPLGAPLGPRVSATVAVPPGSTLLLYSDGLVEWHPDGVAAGLEALRVRLESSAPGCPRADDIAAAVLTQAPEPRPDDIAVLVARLVAC